MVQEQRSGETNRGRFPGDAFSQEEPQLKLLAGMSEPPEMGGTLPG